jgi:hypothetical protein
VCVVFLFLSLPQVCKHLFGFPNKTGPRIVLAVLVSPIWRFGIECLACGSLPMEGDAGLSGAACGLSARMVCIPAGPWGGDPLLAPWMLVVFARC